MKKLVLTFFLSVLMSSISLGQDLKHLASYNFKQMYLLEDSPKNINGDLVKATYRIESKTNRSLNPKIQGLRVMDLHTVFSCSSKESKTDAVTYYIDGEEPYFKNQEDNSRFKKIKTGGVTEVVFNEVCNFQPFDEDDVFAMSKLYGVESNQTVTMIREFPGSKKVKYTLPVFTNRACRSDKQCDELSANVTRMIKEQKPVIEITDYLMRLKVGWDRCDEKYGRCHYLSEKYFPGGFGAYGG